MLLVSCEKSPETDKVTERLNVTKSVQKVRENESIVVDQEVKKKSVMETISPDVLATLDILIDYDKALSFGPEKWDEELWSWKILLKWDQGCDYGPGVSEHPLYDSKYTFVIVQCAGGAYQPTSYTYLLDKETKENIQLTLGRGFNNPERSKEVTGEIIFDTETNQLSILSVAVGGGSCGTYRTFNFVEGDSLKSSSFVVTTTRKQECLDDIRYENYPDSVYDYKNWPIVDE